MTLLQEGFKADQTRTPPFWPMITIATFTTPEEAHLLRSRLESAGIPAFLHSEYAVQNSWLSSNLIGGVRVQISELDLDYAREFLGGEPAEPLPEAVPLLCPACGSTRTEPNLLPGRLSMVSMVLFHLPLPFLRHRWKCAAFDHRFTSTPVHPAP